MFVLFRYAAEWGKDYVSFFVDEMLIRNVTTKDATHTAWTRALASAAGAPMDAAEPHMLRSYYKKTIVSPDTLSGALPCRALTLI